MKKIAWLTILTMVILILGSVGTASAEILPPHGFGQIGLRAEILCEKLTLREEPGASSKAVKELRYGDFIIVIEQSDGWAYCALGDAEDSPKGWVNSDYLAIDPAWYRAEEKTPVYAWNDTAAPKVALLDKDTILPILKADGDWLIVSLRGAVGWIRQRNTAESTETGRQDGERFETVIMLEGMEETVRYEHVRSDAVGIEIDYDCEVFERHSEAECERFISRYDDPDDPQNYFEVVYSAEDADTAAAAIVEALSEDYAVIRETLTLERAGASIRIDASADKDGAHMPELLQAVYIIPAADGCRVAWAHYTIESAEGFGTRIRYIMDTLKVIDRQDVLQGE